MPRPYCPWFAHPDYSLYGEKYNRCGFLVLCIFWPHLRFLKELQITRSMITHSHFNYCVTLEARTDMMDGSFQRDQHALSPRDALRWTASATDREIRELRLLCRTQV